jgi:hypothetical protein
MRTVRRLIWGLVAGILAGAGATPGPASTTPTVAPGVAASIAQARLATAKYATDLERAKADGYDIITPMIPNMGYHFLNPTVQGFDVTKPPILVYVRQGARWQLVALEWVYTERPVRAPLPGARYGAFGAACHYTDGTFIAAASQAQCATTNPRTGAGFTFWHPPLVTLHLWVWYPNPDGVFAEFNPLLTPFNE